MYYAIIYPFILYGIDVWENANKTLLAPIHTLQKKFVRSVTNNDQYPDLPGPLAHTPPLFLHLNVLTVFDIFKLQLGKFVYDAVNNIGPANKIINFNMASTIHSHNTRYANQGNFFLYNARTTRYGLKSLSAEGSKLWRSLPSDIKDRSSKKAFINWLKKYLINFNTVTYKLLHPYSYIIIYFFLCKCVLHAFLYIYYTIITIIIIIIYFRLYFAHLKMLE